MMSLLVPWMDVWEAPPVATWLMVSKSPQKVGDWVLATHKVVCLSLPLNNWNDLASEENKVLINNKEIKPALKC